MAKFISDTEADAFFGSAPVSKGKFIPDNEADAFFSATPEPVNTSQIPRVGGGNIPVVKQLSDVGTGIGTTVGKTAIGAIQVPLKISRALGRAVKADTTYVDKAISGLDKVKTELYEKPFQEQTSTASGKTGQVIATLAPYIATAGVINPATASLGTASRITARGLADVAVSQAQTGGDAKTGLATGVASGVSDAVLGGKAKVVRGILPSLKQIGKTASTGYVSDVASGMAGLRGENRTGAKAFIPGAGTLVAGALGTAMAGASGYKNLKNPDVATINKAKASLEDSYVKFYGGTQAGKKKIDKALFAQEMKNKAGTSGLAPHQILADDAVIPEVKGNQFDTWEQARQYKEKAIKLAQEGKKVLREVELQTPPIKISDLESDAIARANTQQNIDSGDAADLIKNIRREFSKLRSVYGDSIPLSKVDDIKSARWSKIDFSKQNPFAPRVDKLSTDADYIIAKSAQKRIEDTATKAGLEDVAQFNRDIGDRLEAAKFLADLNGKTLKGSFTTRISARIIGATTGTSLPGSIVGVLGGDFVANLLISNSVANPTKRLILRNLYNKSPQSYTKVIEWLAKQGVDRDLRLALPKPSAIYVPPAKQSTASEAVVVGGKKAPVSLEQAKKRAAGLPEYGGLFEYKKAQEASKKAVFNSILPNKNSNKGTSVQRQPNVLSRYRVEDTSQYSLPKNSTSIAEPISKPNITVIKNRITIPKGSSIDQTRKIVNNHLESSLQAIGDVDTFDMISANPTAFYRQQLDDIAMGLKAENPNYSRLSDSISSIDAKKIDSFETLAGKIREKLNAKTFMERVSGKNLPNKQGGFISTGYKDTSNLTTKILKDLEGKTTVSKQYILDATNRGDLKQVERDLTRQILDTMPDGQINVKEFTDKVKSELLPLKVNNQTNKFLTGGTKYESVALPTELRGNVKNYKENIYESPIKTSAGSTHFSGSTENYFGHTRIEDMADNKTRRVIEVQSDLYQKGNLENEVKRNQEFIDFAKSDYGKSKATGDRVSSLKNATDLVEGSKKLQQYNDPTAHFRMVREEIKKAAQDGKTKLQFPTGETAMKIEGLGTESRWYDPLSNDLHTIKIPELKVGKEVSQGGNVKWIITDVLGDGKFKALLKSDVELFAGKKGITFAEALEEGKKSRSVESFDISDNIDTNNPIYKFYEKDVQKYLNKFGGKRVVDDKGVSWVEIPITKEQGKAPVEAFGKIKVNPLLTIAGVTALGVAGTSLYQSKKKKANLPKNK